MIIKVPCIYLYLAVCRCVNGCIHAEVPVGCSRTSSPPLFSSSSLLVCAVLLQPGAEHSCPVRPAANINDYLTAPFNTNRRPLLREQEKVEQARKKMTTPVTLNVGGHLYTTSLSTLQRYPDSMLGAMFRGDFPTTRDSQGNYFIDRDGTLFRYILNFLRTSELTLPVDFTETDLLRKEADFYQIEPLIQCLNDPKPLYPPDIFEQVVELSSTRKLSKYSNPVAVIITQLTITTKVHALLEGISNNFTKWNKHMMDTRDCQVSFTFGPCDYHQEVSLRVHLMDYIMKQGFTIRNTRVHHMSERANENTVEHHWTFCRPAHKVED
uniref:Potassium channel tetramerization domain containing 6b n=3 Tax=Percomorphaceae TaxID=1489872 RepID=A0A4W6E636_LATCA